MEGAGLPDQGERTEKAETRWRRTRLGPFWSLERERKLRNAGQVFGEGTKKARRPGEKLGQ